MRRGLEAADARYLQVPMTPRQARFVEEYLVDLNGTQAAIRAGYSATSASEIARQLLEKTGVSEAVARAKAERSARIGLTADRVLEELVAVGFSRLSDFAEWGPEQFVLRESDDVDSRAVSSVTVKETVLQSESGDTIVKREQGIKLHDKIGTLKLLGQHIGLFPEKHEHSGPNGEPFQVEVKARDYREGLTPFLPPADELEP